MLRVSKFTDYAIVLMTYVAKSTSGAQHTARQLALDSNLPLPTVSKTLKMLARAGLLASVRGKHGGYHLAREPGEISVADMIVAIEGPVALTECNSVEEITCELEGICPVQSSWEMINEKVLGALEALNLADMASPGTLCGHHHASTGKDRSLLEILNR